MSASKAQYITTTLPYVNAEPHIGFAMEIIQADIIARWKELQGYEVYFNTGTDEHGLKIYRKAQEEGKEVQAYVDEFALKFKELKNTLNLHPNLHFIRTTDKKHIEAAQELWRRSLAKGDIYKKKYKGLYCVGDEAFVKETDLVDGKCPNHPNMDLVEIEEENYFFKLSNYREKLREYLDKGAVIPDWRREEAKNIASALEDFSISRDKSRLPWGVPVPGDDSQVMYVWFDALTSYISTLGWPNGGDFEKFWNNAETLQMAGKDQVKFQSVIWQAMLMSADIKPTDLIFYHGFINSGGQKMSKSLGNVIAPGDLVSEYGVDAVRYYLARHISTFEDGDITPESFKEAYNANLANGIGNLVSRVMTMAEKNLEGPVEITDRSVYPDFASALENFNIQQAANIIWHHIGDADKLIQEKEPFKLVKTNPEEAKEIISNLVREIARIASMLKVFLPETASRIEECVKANRKPEISLFQRKD